MDRVKLFNDLFGLIIKFTDTSDIMKRKELCMEIHDIYKKIKDRLPELFNLVNEIPPKIMILQHIYISIKESDPENADEMSFILNMLLEKSYGLIDESDKNWFDVNFLLCMVRIIAFKDYKIDISWELQRNLYSVILSSFKNECEFNYPVIPFKERNHETVVVFMNNFVGLRHGPTRNALDYCYNLIEKLKKNVLLISVCDTVTIYDFNYAILFSDFGVCSNVDKNAKEFLIKREECNVDYLDSLIRLIPCELNQNNMEQIKHVIDLVYEMKPSIVYNIGGNNLVADICGMFTAEVTIPCGSRFPYTDGKYLILPRKVEERDKKQIEYVLKKQQVLIESHFPYKIEKPQKFYRKRDFDFNDDDFIIMIIGTRLDDEIAKEFSEFLKILINENDKYKVVFLGEFNNFNSWKNNCEEFQKTYYLGFTHDVAGVLSIADVYLNPFRYGGGTSSAEALSRRVPVVTLPQCDVAYTCQDEFICENKEKMIERVNKYYTDKQFYREHKRLAYEQYKKVINTEQTLSDIIGIVMNEEQKQGETL